MVDEDAVDLRLERAEVLQVLHADRAAANLVLISRTDTTARGADLADACGCLAQLVEFAVEGQDQRGRSRRCAAARA